MNRRQKTAELVVITSSAFISILVVAIIFLLQVQITLATKAMGAVMLVSSILFFFCITKGMGYVETGEEKYYTAISFLWPIASVTTMLTIIIGFAVLLSG